MERKVKLNAGAFKVPATLIETGGRIEVHFAFNRPLLEEIKVMEGSKYHGYDPNPRKIWSISDTPHNRFQLSYMLGENVYAHWDQQVKEFPATRKVYKHQQAMINFGLTYHYCIFAAEMGTGKSLSAIEVMEQSKIKDWLWVGPKSALAAVNLELKKWNCKVKPIMMTYEHLVKVMTGWTTGADPPHGVIFDESSRMKNHTAQRSQAGQQLANAIRIKWRNEGYVIEMSGSPAPKSPVDWYSQCRIACPGYLREGRVDKFRARLALFQQKETGAGSFPQLVCWWDDENKCGICGQKKDHQNHSLQIMGSGFHDWIKSKNEVDFLYKRMKGLVLVQFKKDALDLPDKIYKMVFCPPTRELLNSMQAITARVGKGIKALTLCRELSDGFQYQDTPDGEETCELCDGNRTTTQQFYTGPEFSEDELAKVGVMFAWQHPDGSNHSEWWESKEAACTHCSGTGRQVHYTREVVEVTCPKDDALRSILEDHEDIGRIVLYAGFTGSIDRLVRLCQREKWSVIRVDGQGWNTDLAINGLVLTKPEEMLEAFQSPCNPNMVENEFPRIAFIGHPGSAGMGLTLTASPTICYYSNDYNAESRIQSEDRIHRPGMDKQRGATIIDLIHLPSDKLVLDNLKAKKDLQSMTMGQLAFMLEKAIGQARAV